ncbi:MAG TPA: ATP-binding cassette domain-containing protein [Candidatus Thioglobus sp.]|nr:ATP-binding cassette domain-containing protein [Candidatus Thioglobus sp.]
MLTFKLVVASFVIAVLSLATSLFVIQVLNRFISHGINTTLLTLVTGTSIAILFELAFRSVRRRLIIIQNEEQNNKLSEGALFMLLQTKTPELDRVPIGQRQEVLRGIDILRAITSPQTIAAVLDLPFSFVFVFVLWLLSPPLALISLVFMSLILIISLVAQFSGRAVTKQAQERGADRSALLGSAITEAETVRAFNATQFFVGGWRKVDRMVSKLTGSIAESRDILQARIALLTGLQTMAIISVGAIQAVNGDLSVGAMIGANILAGRALMPVSKLSQMGEAFTKATQARVRLNEFASLPIERSEGTALKEYHGGVTFKDLAFIYPGSSAPLFESINLHIAPGQVATIVGPNGSGKTTLARLLVGTIEPTRGQIMVDGLDLNQIALPWWRQQVSYLPQEPTFITGTLSDNIALANPQIDNERLNEVIRMAGLRNFLDNSPEGLAMPIREGGRHLALGIRRRIALARALATGGNLLIADEPTEGLDMEGRRAVYATFQQLINEGKSIIVISHDQEFLKVADYLVDLGVKPIPSVQKKQRSSVADGSNKSDKNKKEET